jgi:hypothetical protein
MISSHPNHSMALSLEGRLPRRPYPLEGRVPPRPCPSLEGRLPRRPLAAFLPLTATLILTLAHSLPAASLEKT